jgi:tryptophan synthase alpha chain
MNPFNKQNKQLSIFITAGYPALESTTQQILSLQEQGIDFIEVGIPFSDPMADGPVIQETSSIALKNGMQLDLLFEQLLSIKDKVQLPIVIMGYLNPVLQYGIEKFLSKCQEIEIASVILPDMSLELYERFYQSSFEIYGIQVSFLITPTTSNDRIKRISEVSKNSFVYLVSQSSITGGNSAINTEKNDRYKEIKKLCSDVPVMLGFGINSEEDVVKAQANCDGAIIGSAYLKALKNGKELEFIKNFSLKSNV